MGEMSDVPSFVLCYRCFSDTTLAPVATFLLGLFVAFVTATPGAAPQLGSSAARQRAASSNKSPGLVSLVPNSEMNRPG